MATESEADDFGKKISVITQHGFTALAIAYGSRLGLFEIMVKFSEPKTSQEIADAAGFKERYVREWLGAMVVAGIVQMKRSPDLYFLSKDRHSTLVGSNLPTLTEALFLLGKVEKDVIGCFQRDGPLGIHESKYEGFLAWQDSLTSKGSHKALKEVILPSVPGLMEKLESGATLCDIGGSTGAVTNKLAAEFPNSMAYNVELSQEAVTIATDNARMGGIQNAIHQNRDASHLPSDWSEKFDYVTAFNAIHDMSFPDRGLSEIFRILKPDCYMSMIDTTLHSHPLDNIGDARAPYIYTISLACCLPLSTCNEGGQGLGAAWGIEKATQMLEEAGFEVAVLPIHAHSYNGHFLCHKPAN